MCLTASCYIGRVNVVVVQTPAAVHQTHTYTLTAAQRRELGALLSSYRCCCVLLLLYCSLLMCGCEAKRLSGCSSKKNTALLFRLVYL